MTKGILLGKLYHLHLHECVGQHIADMATEQGYTYGVLEVYLKITLEANQYRYSIVVYSHLQKTWLLREPSVYLV